MHLYAILKLLKTFDSPWTRGVVSKWWDVLYDAHIAGTPRGDDNSCRLSKLNHKTTTFAFFCITTNLSSYLIQYIKTISNNVVTIILGKQTSALQKEIINKSSIRIQKSNCTNII